MPVTSEFLAFEPERDMRGERVTKRRQLRKFGLTMGFAFLLLGGIAWWRDAGIAPYLLGIGGAFALLGLVVPRALGPVEFLWMKLALVLSYVMTRVILTLAFYLAIMPMGFLLRLMGKDLLSRRIDRSGTSYWVPVEPDGSHTRLDKPY